MMEYKINEIFYSLQGEGRYSGVPAVFIRFSGCNLKCSFCDTRHETHDTYTEEGLLKEISQYPTKFVIFTGGEPTLQITEELLLLLKGKGYRIAIETNGSHNIPTSLIDWVTVSPKALPIKIGKINEIKVVFPNKKHNFDKYVELAKTHNVQCLYLQPCDTGNQEQNERILNETIDYIKENPIWSLSLQTQKILNVR